MEKEEGECSTTCPADESDNSETETESVSEEPDHPWPYLAPLFKFICKAGKTYRFQCLLCQPKKVECSAYMNSPSNLKKHTERLHPSHVAQYDGLVAGSRKRKADNVSGQRAEKPRKEQNTITGQCYFSSGNNFY